MHPETGRARVHGDRRGRRARDALAAAARASPPGPCRSRPSARRTRSPFRRAGGGSQSWSVASGSLPAGLALSGGGLLAGTPTTSGTFTFTARVTGNGRSAEKGYTLVVRGAARRQRGGHAHGRGRPRTDDDRARRPAAAPGARAGASRERCPRVSRSTGVGPDRRHADRAGVVPAAGDRDGRRGPYVGRRPRHRRRRRDSRSGRQGSSSAVSAARYRSFVRTAGGIAPRTFTVVVRTVPDRDPPRRHEGDPHRAPRKAGVTESRSRRGTRSASQRSGRSRSWSTRALTRTLPSAARSR